MRPRILFVGGSLNQTSMLYAVSRHLEEQADCYFTPYYAQGLLGRMAAHGMLDFTILGGRHRQDTEAYLERQRLNVDCGGSRREYDLVVTGSDAIVPHNLRRRRMVLVQEGMIEPAGWVFRRAQSGIAALPGQHGHNRAFGCLRKVLRCLRRLPSALRCARRAAGEDRRDRHPQFR